MGELTTLLKDWGSMTAVTSCHSPHQMFQEYTHTHKASDMSLGPTLLIQQSFA